jgi:hypothetical protein
MLLFKRSERFFYASILLIVTAASIVASVAAPLLLLILSCSYYYYYHHLARAGPILVMMMVSEFAIEFLSVSFCESSLLFMAVDCGGGGVTVDHPHPPSSPLAVATADHTYKVSTQRD